MMNEEIAERREKIAYKADCLHAISLQASVGGLYVKGVSTLRTSALRVLAMLGLLLGKPMQMRADVGEVDYSWGASALADAEMYVATMMTYVSYIVYTIASVVAIISALQIYIKMNVGEPGITKQVVTLFGAVLFIIGASLVMPAFFGYNYG